MSIATVQFVEMVRQAYAALVEAPAPIPAFPHFEDHKMGEGAERRWCLVCEAETSQKIERVPGWTRCRCLECGYVENVQEVRHD